MIYKREYIIKGKIISKKNIINIITDIKTKYLNDDKLKLKIEVNFEDGSSIIDSDISLFGHKNFELLKIKSIYIRFDYKYEDEIIINLSCKSDSRIRIELCDSTRYEAICHCIDENIKHMKNQNKAYLLGYNPCGMLFVLIASVILELLLVAFFEYILKIKLLTVIIYFMVLILPNLIAVITVRSIEKKYPVNQFYFENYFLNNSTNEKNWIIKFLIFVFTNIILPIIVAKMTN